MYSVEEAIQLIKESGLKATHQRMVIFRSLAASTAHPTVDWIFEKVKESYPSISLATVYKTMETFVEAGLVKRVKCEDGKPRFDANLEPHNHLYCESTGKIFDFKDAGLQSVIEEYLASRQLENFEISDIQLQLNGRVVDPNKPVQYKT